MFDLFSQVLFILLITIGIVATFRRLKYPPIVGYIVVGLIISIIGQHAFDHFGDLNILARYGVVFLLFSIGLEFSLPRLLSMRTTVFGLGGLQMGICAGLTFLISDFIFGLSAFTSFVVAIAIAMSSTAIISKILDEGGELSTNVGQLSMSMLIFQDLMVVPAIIITSFFAKHSDSALLTSLFVELVKGVIAFIILILIGKKIFTPIFNEVARSHSSELFTLATLFAALSAAYISEVMGMSKEFGAFLAGAIIGGTPYHHQVESDIRPFRDVLLGIFFIGIGTMINLNVFIKNFSWVLLVSFIILIGKLITINYLVYALRLGHPREATKTGLLLAQAGEFGFVLIALATQYNFLGDNQAQILLAALICSMLLSIMTLRYQNFILPLISKLLYPHLTQQHSKLPRAIKKNTVIICGYSRVGQSIAKALQGQGFHYLALDLDPVLVRQAQLAGEEVIYADATDLHILRGIHIDHAKAVVLTFQDPQLSSKIIERIRMINPDVPVFARTKNDVDIGRLLQAGANEVIPDMLEASLMLSLHVLVNLGVDIKKAIEWSENLRRDRYKLLQGYFQGGQANPLTNADAQHHQQKALMIYEHFSANGKTIHQLNPESFGIELIALRKKGILGHKPAPNAKVHAGDVLIVQGLQDNIEKFEWFLLEG